MWDCEPCGCQGIAGDLLRCPGCGQDRVTPSASEAPAPLVENQAAQQDTEQQPDAAATAGTDTGSPGVAAFIGERGPELWDRSKSVADNLAAEPGHAESDPQDDTGGA